MYGNNAVYSHVKQKAFHQDIMQWKQKVFSSSGPKFDYVYGLSYLQISRCDQNSLSG